MQELAARFVPATDEVWRLHHRDDPETRHFQSFMNRGIYRDRAGHSTRQGIFAVAPSGVLLADINSTRPGPMKQMLRRALARWEELPRAERLLPYDPETRRAEIQRQEKRWPEDGVAMRVHVRDLPREGLPADWRGAAWNLDHAWFREGELRGLLPRLVRKKATQPWPRPLVERIVRLHLTDYVRGQTTPHAPDFVHEASLTTEVVKVRRGKAELRFTGSVRVCSGPWSDSPDGAKTRGVQADLLGRGTWEEAADGFTELELIAVGVRWGRTQFNFREDDLGPSPIGWVFSLAPEGERVPPASLGDYGW